LIVLLIIESNHADFFNSNSLDDGIGQELSQGLSWAMQFSTKLDKEDMAQPITPVPKCEDSRIKVDFRGFQTYKVCPPSSNHRSIYINGIHNTILGQNSILVSIQQGGKSSWNRPHIQISDLTLNGSKHTKYQHLLLFIDPYILMGFTTKFWG
jgi:hypothetical protein